MRADRRAQRLRRVQPDRIQSGVIFLTTRPRFEPDLGDAERARDEALFDADVLNAIEGDGAMLARTNAACTALRARLLGSRTIPSASPSAPSAVCSLRYTTVRWKFGSARPGSATSR